MSQELVACDGGSSSVGRGAMCAQLNNQDHCSPPSSSISPPSQAKHSKNSSPAACSTVCYSNSTSNAETKALCALAPTLYFLLC